MQGLSFEFETLVVDNGSQDGTANFLIENRFAFDNIGLRLICNTENVGLSRATEQAYRESKGNWILLCNPDILFNPSVQRLYDFGIARGDSVVTAELVNEDGTPQRVIHRRFPTVGRVFFDFGYIGAYLDKKLMHSRVRMVYTYQNEVFPGRVSIESPGGSFLLLNRDIIAKLGFIFDPMLPIWWNDVDLAKRAEEAGIRRILMSDVKIRHSLARGGSRQMESVQRRYMFCRSMLLYSKKWRMRPSLVRLLFFADAIIGVSLLTMASHRKTKAFWRSFKIAMDHAAAQVSAVASA